MEDSSEQPPAAKDGEPKQVALRGLPWLLAAVTSVWCVWAFGVSRGAVFPMSAVHGHDPVTPTPQGALLLALALLMPLLFSSRLAVRAAIGAAIPAVALAMGLLSATSTGWDAGAYVFAAVAALAGLLLVVKRRKVGVSARRLTPLITLVVVLTTQAFSPSVAMYPQDLVGDTEVAEVEAGPACDAVDLARQSWSSSASSGWMTVGSLCAYPAAALLTLGVPDGCRSASEAYAALALLQGPNADDPARAAVRAQTYLTGSWLRGKARMESGFCVDTEGDKRVFTRPDGVELYTVTVATEGEALEKVLTELYGDN